MKNKLRKIITKKLFKTNKNNKTNYYEKDSIIKENINNNENAYLQVIENDLLLELETTDNSLDTIVSNELNNCDKEFDNNNFLKDGKYLNILSNSYVFMKYVIDKDFNNLAYIDTSNIDEKILTKIIDYACNIVYDLRKENNNIMFDIEGIFKTSHIINNEYFNLCLKYLK